MDACKKIRLNEKLFDSDEQFEALLAQELQIAKSWQAANVFCSKREQMGFELEFWMLDATGRPMPANTEFLQRYDGKHVVTEVHASELEINANVHDMSADVLSKAEMDIASIWADCLAQAKDLGAQLIMAGTLPSATHEHITDEYCTPSQRYRQIEASLFELRDGKTASVFIEGKETVQHEMKSIAINGLTASFQIHLRVPADRYVRYYNASLVASSILVAITGNSPYLLGKSAWEETRITSFEQALAVTDKVKCCDFSQRYLEQSWTEILDENYHAFPRLIPNVNTDMPKLFHHTRLQNSVTYPWSRLVMDVDKEGVPHVRIEFRVLPAGPTIVDMVANTAFYMGLIEALAMMPEAPEQLLSIEQARDNFYACAEHGLEGRVTWLDGEQYCVKDLIREQLIAMAADGLIAKGISDEDRTKYLSIIQGRVDNGQTGSVWQQKMLAELDGDFNQMVLAYVRQQNTNQPVHTWPQMGSELG